MGDEVVKFGELCATKNYKEQAIWFLNGFFDEIEKDAEKLWEWVKHFEKLDLMGPDRKGEEGHQLDQFWSAKFLEDMDKAITAKERKEALRTIDVDNSGSMACLEYLLWKYKKSIGDVANASQGENKEAIDAAKEQIKQVQAALDDVLEKLNAQKAALKAQQEAIEQQKQALAEQQRIVAELNQLLEQQKQLVAEVQQAVADAAKALEEQQRALAECQAARAANAEKLAQQKVAIDESSKALAAAQAATEALRAAKVEQQAALDALKAEEEAYAAKIKSFEDLINDDSTSGMKKARAKNELAQLKSEDPLPLRRAKITAEAAMRKVEKQTKIAEAAEKDAADKKAALQAVEKELQATQKELEAKEAVLAQKKAECEQKKAALEAKQAEAEAKERELAAKKQEAEEKEAELERIKQELIVKEQELAKAVTQLECAYADLNQKMEDAQTQLSEIKSAGGTPWGAVWFMERELFEADSRLPTSKMKFDHSKPFHFEKKE